MSGTAVFRHFAEEHGLPEPLVGALAAGVEEEFLYCAAGLKRYAYRRSWDASKPYVLWVMLNPGTGETEQRARPTLGRCVDWSRKWGYGGLCIGNVFATRTRSARQLLQHELSADPLNDQALAMMRAAAPDVIVAWGGKGARHQRAAILAQLLDGASCLGFTAKGEPRHPLYVPATAQRVPWTSKAAPPLPRPSIP